MKLLVLCERVDAEGGTETYLRTLLPALIARGDRVHVVARSLNVPGAYEASDEHVGWSDEHDPPDGAAGERIAEIVRTFAPDAAIAHNVLDRAVLAAARAAPRFVYHLHDHRPFCPNGDRLYPQGEAICHAPMGTAVCGLHALLRGCAYGPRPRTLALTARRRAVARAVADADAVIALSRYVARVAEANGVARGRLHVVAPPLADDAFAAIPAARPQEDAVLFAGRVMPSKGARSLVRALARIERPLRPRLDIAGDGPDLARTLDDAQHCNLEVRALGRLETRALREAIDAVTLVAVPSRWAEPYGLIGVEAFARARPVAAYDVGGIGEWLGAGGIAVARGDETALAGAVRALLGAARWSEASRNAFAQAQALRGDASVEQLRALYAGGRS